MAQKYLYVLLLLLLSSVIHTHGKFCSLRNVNTNANFHNSNLYISMDSITFVCPVCFVSVTNFVGVNFIATTSPILLRRLAQAIFTNKFLKQFIIEVLYEYSKRLGNQTIQYNSSIIPDTCISNYLFKEIHFFGLKTLFHPGNFSKLSKDIFTMNSRPWNHEFHVLLHPPIFSTCNSKQNNSSAHVPYFGIKMWEHSYFMEATSFSITMLIMAYNESEMICGRKEVANMQNKSFGKPRISRADQMADVFVIDWNFNGKLKNIGIVPPCSQTIYQDMFVLNKNHQENHVIQVINNYLLHQINISDWNFLSQTDPLSYYTTVEISQTYWKLVANPVRKKLPRNYVNFMLHSKLFELLAQLFSPNFLFKSSSKLAQTSICGVSVNRLGELSRTMISFNYQASRIRFLGCGDTTRSHYIYDSIVSTFDGTTWSLLLILLLAMLPMTISFMSFSKLSHFPNYAMAQFSVIKLVLEQSTPFSGRQTENFKQKLLCLTSLLGIFVVLNEYKNGKIADIVSSDRFVPFLIFYQLVKANYSIFAELGADKSHSAITFSSTHKQNCSPYIKKSRSLYFCRNLSQTQYKSWAIHSQIVVQLYDFYSKQDLRNEISGNSTLMEESKEHVKTVMADQVEITAAVSTRIRKLQEVATLSRLRVCNKTAVLVYEPQIWRYENILRMAGSSKISLGKEKLLESRLGLLWESWIPPFIFRRIRSIDGSGIFDWWNNIVTVYLPKMRTRLELNGTEVDELETERRTRLKKLKEARSSTINVAQILGFGAIAATICFSFELLWKHLKIAFIIGIGSCRNFKIRITYF